MIAIPHAEPVPITLNDDGVIRVGGTRVTLETVVATFQQGATPEVIVEKYPVLSLRDVYLVVGYYLSHREEVDDYMRRQGELSEQVRRENEARFNPEGVRARLEAKLAQKRQNNDSPAG